MINIHWQEPKQFEKCASVFSMFQTSLKLFGVILFPSNFAQIIIMMKFQKRKFLSNLARMSIFKEGYSELKRFLMPFKMVQALMLAYMMVIRTDDALGNAVFTALRQVHEELKLIAALPFILSAALIAICASILTPLLLLSRKDDIIEFQQQVSAHKRTLLKAAALFSFTFSYCAPIFLMAIVSISEINSLASFGYNFIHFCAILTCEVIVIICRERVVYSYRLILVLGALVTLPSLMAYSAASLLSLLALREDGNDLMERMAYLLVICLSLLLTLQELTQVGLSVTQLTIILTLLFLIHLVTPPSTPPLTPEIENDLLLACAEKLLRDETLSWDDKIKIITIAQNVQIQHKTELEVEKIPSQVFNSVCLEIGKGELLELIRVKLDLDARADPSNLNFLIQKYQCELLQKTFSIHTLYSIEKLNLQLQHAARYDQVQRIETLINTIEVNFLRIDDELNSSLIFRIEKQIERFYLCIGEGIEELLAVWRMITVRQVGESLFNNSIQQIVELEQEAIRILEELSKYRNMTFEKEVFNYWHRITNVNTNNYFPAEQPRDCFKLTDTKFLLISNSTIEDASHTIAKQITLNREDSLIGIKFSQVLYDFYNAFLEKELTNIISLNDSHTEILMPFRVINHDKRFLLFSCTFKILPDLSRGVKYLINFSNRRDDTRKYALYCLDSDTIEGFSDTFFQKYRIDENMLPDLIAGQEVFSFPLSTHLSDEKVAKGMVVKCELKLHDLRKHTKSARAARHSIPLMLTIQDIYPVRGLHYVLLEMTAREESTAMNAQETIRQLVSEGREDGTRITDNQIANSTFCRIRNPLESVIDDKLSRINNSRRASYFKVAAGMMGVMMAGIGAALVFARVSTASTGSELEAQLGVVGSTNTLVLTVYSLFYQYYQYYQISNYPQQLLTIQHYNIPAEVREYYAKANANVQALLPLILQNHNTQNEMPLAIKLGNTSIASTTDIINMVDFLSGVKAALADNQPVFLVQNYYQIAKIINSFIPYDNEVLNEFLNKVMLLFGSVLSLAVVLCVAVRALHLRVTLFQWHIFQVYSEISEPQLNSHTAKLEEFLSLLINIKYYNHRGSKKPKPHELSTRDTLSEALAKANSGEIQPSEAKGVNRRSLISVLISNNLIFLIPAAVAAFFLLYYSLASTYEKQSDAVLNYSSELQKLSLLILERATQYFQSAMEAILPPADRLPWIQQHTFSIPTKVHQELPSYFGDYKQLENNMLNFNLCDYAYLNTGSLYRGINCSAILDGMMNSGFTETYAFLLEKIEEQGGAAIQDLGTQRRPAAKYPFYMEVCYARRTINNMLAVVQKNFDTAVKGFLKASQSTLESAAAAGFALLPLGVAAVWLSMRRLRADCALALKAFRILPRAFLMHISTSKKLQALGALQELEMVAV